MSVHHETILVNDSLLSGFWIVNAWFSLFAAFWMAYVMPFKLLVFSSLIMRVSAELLLVPRLPLIGRNLTRRDGRFHSLSVALHDTLFSCIVGYEPNFTYLHFRCVAS